jgi:hypothetical protein
MKGHVGAVLTAGVAALALALALLQAAVIAHATPRYPAASASRTGPSNRFSLPGGRSGVPWLPFDDKAPAAPDLKPREGGSPAKQPEEHRPPPPPSRRSVPPSFGPHPPRRAVA